MSHLPNKYPGKCYICHNPVAPFEGHVISRSGLFYVSHAGCKASDPTPAAPPAKQDFKRAAANDKDD